MHIVLGILAAVGVIAFWIMRANQAAQASRELGEAVGDASGAVRRFFWRRRTQVDPIKQIEDPRLAATAMMCALAQSDSLLTDRERQVILEQMAHYLEVGGQAAEEMFAEARWLTKEMRDLDTFLRRLAAPVNQLCSAEEKAQLLEMLSAVADAEGVVSELQQEAIRRLRDSLALSRR